VADDLIIYELALGLLNAAAYELEQTSAGVPAGMRVCIVPGEVAWDDCCEEGGQLTVTVTRVYPSRTFPNDDDFIAPCGAPYMAVNLSITVMRCAPTQDENGVSPSCEALDEAAKTHHADMRAVWKAVQCYLYLIRQQPYDYEVLMGEQTPEGPLGGCVGSTMKMTVGINNDCGCV
jgi:hypothetical protein